MSPFCNVICSFKSINTKISALPIIQSDKQYNFFFFSTDFIKMAHLNQADSNISHIFAKAHIYVLRLIFLIYDKVYTIHYTVVFFQIKLYRSLSAPSSEIKLFETALKVISTTQSIRIMYLRVYAQVCFYTTSPFGKRRQILLF